MARGKPSIARRCMAKPLDPELRVFARAASDDKAPIMMMLTAVDLLKASGQGAGCQRQACILDSEEEIGSPSLAGVVASNAALFKADALVILDGPGTSIGPTDARVRQSRHHAGDARGLRTARAAAQRALRQLRAESRVAPGDAAGRNEGRRRSRARTGLLRRRRADGCRPRGAWPPPATTRPR